MLQNITFLHFLATNFTAQYVLHARAGKMRNVYKRVVFMLNLLTQNA